MPVVLKNKFATPLSLPYPFRGILNAGESVLLDLSPDEALTALGILAGRRNSAIDVKASNATSGFDTTFLGDATLGIGGRFTILDAVPNEVIVTSLGNFPSPSGGVISLVADTIYFVVGAVDIGANAFLLANNTEIRGRSTFSRDSITSTNAGAMIRVTDTAATVKVADVAFVTTGIMHDVDCASYSTTNSTFQGSTLGTIQTTLVTLMRTIGFFGFSAGLVLTGTNSSIVFNEVQFIQADGTGGAICLDLGASTFNAIGLTTVGFVIAANGFGLSGLVDSGNIPTGRAIVTTTAFDGAGTALKNITVDDLRWRFAINEGVAGSIVSGSFSQDPGTEATAVTNDTKLVLTTTAGTLHRISAPISNRLKLLHLTPETLRASMCLSVEKTGGAVDFDFGVAVNGTIVKEVLGVEISTKRTLVSCTFELPIINTGDELELFASTVGGPTTINVTGAVLLARL